MKLTTVPNLFIDDPKRSHNDEMCLRVYEDGALQGLI